MSSIDRRPSSGPVTPDSKGIIDREANITTLSRLISSVEDESARLRGTTDTPLRLSAEPGTYWVIQAQRGLISGQDEMPSLTATLHPKKKDGLAPFESIRADLANHFGIRLGGIHLYPRTGERSWNENDDIPKLAGLVDEYFKPKPTATEKAVAWAAKVAREELGEISEARIGNYIVGVNPESDNVMIRELNSKNGTRRLIMSDPGAPESPDGTPARPARIIVQDIDKGTIILDQKTTRKILRRTIMQIFPEHTEKPILDGSKDFA